MDFRMSDREMAQLARMQRVGDINKLASTLLAQCQSENVTYAELESIAAQMLHRAKETPVVAVGPEPRSPKPMG